MQWTLEQVAAWALHAGWVGEPLRLVLVHVQITSGCDDTHQVPIGPPNQAREAGLIGVDLVKYPPPEDVNVWRGPDAVRYALVLFSEAEWAWTWHAGNFTGATTETYAAADRAIGNPQATIDAQVADVRRWRALTSRLPWRA